MPEFNETQNQAAERLLDLSDKTDEVNWRIACRDAAEEFRNAWSIAWPTLNCNHRQLLTVEDIEDWNKSERVTAMYIRWYIHKQLYMLEEMTNERLDEISSKEWS